LGVYGYTRLEIDVVTKRLEFSPKSKVLACLRYYPEIVQPIVDCVTGGARLTNDKAKQILPSIFEQIKCVGLSEINRAGRCDSKPEQVDHIMANEVKPDNSPENGRPICALCHKVKTARDAQNAAKGRLIRRETKEAQRKDAMRGKHFPKGAKIGQAVTEKTKAKPKAKIKSRWKKKLNGQVVDRYTGEPL
jgi:hypothetical protein